MRIAIASFDGMPPEFSDDQTLLGLLSDRGVEEGDEAAVVMIDGEVSHVLRKRSLLGADEVAPIRADDALGVAEVMYDPDLVLAGSAADRLADAIVARALLRGPRG